MTYKVNKTFYSQSLGMQLYEGQKIDIEDANIAIILLGKGLIEECNYKNKAITPKLKK